MPTIGMTGSQNRREHSKKASEHSNDFEEIFTALRSLVPIVKFFNNDLADSLLKLANGLPVLMQALSSLGHNVMSKRFSSLK